VDMRILLVKLSAIGDVVQALPVLAALRSRYPDAHLSWMVGEAASDLLLSHPLLDHVIVFPRRHFGTLSSNPRDWPRLMEEAGGFLRRLRSQEYDVVIDLQGLLKSGILAWLSKGVCRLGFAGGREFSSVFLNRRLPPYDPDEHAVLRYLRLAAALDAPVQEPEFPLGVGSAETEKVGCLLRDAGAGARPVLCLNPGAAWTSKQWTAQGFAAVTDISFRRWNMFSVVLGGVGDRNLAREIARLAGSPVLDLAGRTDLRTLAAVYQRATVVVSTDTGPMHLAAAAGAPVVALFGPTAPWRTGPFGRGNQVIRLGLSCSPCFRRRCRDPRCMVGITPDQVIEAVGKAVGG
jgi:heptosyltransferase-1